MFGWLKQLLPCFHDWQPGSEPWEMWSPIVGTVWRQRFDCRKCGRYQVRDSGQFMGQSFTHKHPSGGAS